MSLCDYRLYCLLLADGSVKLGLSSCFRQRRIALKFKYGSAGWAFVAPEVVRGFRAESELLARAEKMACARRGRERFYGLQFGEAVNLVKQVSRTYASRPAPAPHKIGRKLTVSKYSGMVTFGGLVSASLTERQASAAIAHAVGMPWLA